MFKKNKYFLSYFSNALSCRNAHLICSNAHLSRSNVFVASFPTVKDFLVVRGKCKVCRAVHGLLWLKYQRGDDLIRPLPRLLEEYCVDVVVT